MQQNNIIIGVTGITGSGASTVAEILSGHGGYVVQADKLAHETMVKGEPAYTEIVELFGSEILYPDGRINRRALGARVFENKGELSKLEKIIHPRVIEKTRELIAAAAAAVPLPTPSADSGRPNDDSKPDEGSRAKYSFAVIDAPLLIESGMDAMCDSVWLVSAPDKLRLARIMARDDLDEKTAERRLNSRQSENALRPRANVIIENDGSAIALRSKTVSALRGVLMGHGRRGLEVLNP